ncbi:MAG TPA: UvrD-helicase domain-containing protein, partial [Gemmataceae bacterium]|nr:UvrD-helicase domain-containing protein [Gemmataceae bacterium]
MLTPQQDAAVTRREVSVVLSSGAGCGKTHVLTERYLSHLREGAEVGQVVAITFTDRAARQMRDRIRRAVVAELRAARDEDDAERWARHLRALETAQVSTIHAFCGTLLRQHAVEAGLDPLFDVLDEVMAANLRAAAHADALQELLTAQGAAGDDLRELVFLYGWRPTVAAVEHLVGGADGPAWQDWLRRPPEDLAREWVETHARDFLPRYVEYLVAASPRIARCLWLLRQTECIGPETRENVGRILDETPRLATAPDLAAAVAALTEAAKVGKERGKAWKSEGDYEAVRKAFEGYRAELGDRLALFTEEPGEVAAAAAAGQRFL